MRIGVLAALLGVGATGGGAPQLATPPPALLAMTPQDFQRSASVKDDALEVEATITTEPGYQEKHGLLRLVWSDSFLRAFVNKKSGATTFQLYQRIVYGGRYYRYFQAVNYETAAGPRAVDTINVGRTERCSRSQLTGGCVRTEDLAVPIDAKLLQTIAADYAPGGTAAWHFRFKAQTGEDFDGVIVPAEVAGLLAAVADYRQTHGLAAQAATQAPAHQPGG